MVRTQLSGFSKITFSVGIRFAYREAFARRYSIEDIARVIITNIRDRADRRTLRAGSGVEFDVQVSATTTVAAEALQLRVKGGDAAEELELLDEFKASLGSVAASGMFDDVASTFEAPAQLAVNTEQAMVALETGAPTPAPTSDISGTCGASATSHAVCLGALGVGGMSVIFLLYAAARTMFRRSPTTRPRPKIGMSNFDAPIGNPMDGHACIADVYPEVVSAEESTVETSEVI